ncbi:MAG: hypothetical protein ACQESH_08255 [Campylobacterota bacterium]
MKLIKKVVLLFIAGMFLCISLQAQRIPSFTLEGALQKSETLRMKPQDLEGPWAKEFEIFDPYIKKNVIYRGVLIDEFVERFGAPQTKRLVLTAADSFKAVLEKEEWESTKIMLVFQTEGKYMGLKNYGPLRIVYPDYDPKKIQVVEWIWMIKTIKFEK